VRTQNSFLALQQCYEWLVSRAEIYSIMVACMSCTNNYWIMFMLLTKKEILLTIISLSKAALHLFHTANVCGFHSKETFKNVTAPLRLPVSRLTLFGHTSCQVTRVQSHGLLWEGTEIQEIFYRYIRCERICGGCEASLGCYIMCQCINWQWGCQIWDMLCVIK